MVQPQTVKLTFIRGKSLKSLTKLNPYKSLFAIALEWILMAGAIILHMTYSHPLVYFVSWIILSTRLYALYSLIHDAIHYLIIRGKNNNDVVSQIFLGLPQFISLKQMRKAHLAHHKYLQTENDPEMKHLEYEEFQFPKSKNGLLKLFLFDLFGINFMYYQVLRVKNILLNFKPSTFKKDRVLLFFFYTTIFTAAILLGWWKSVILYWIIPYATLYQVLNRLRLSTEHFNIYEESLNSTRSVIPSFFEKWTLTPHNLGFHLDHHLYPGVPFYNLPKLHQLLSEHPTYKSQAIVESSYFHVIKKCIK